MSASESDHPESDHPESDHPESDHPESDHPESDHPESDSQPWSGDTDPAPRLEWSTPAPALAVVALGGVAFAVAAFLASDGASRLLIGLAAVLMLSLAALGLRQRPRLTVVPGPPAQLVIRGLLGPAVYGPEQILRARVVGFRRLGRSIPNLELDVEHKGDERLLIFGRWDLGTHPQDVLDVMSVHGLAPAEPGQR
ncbi:PH domain-containing protein [Nocardia spumae]|uniref:PH domain-containing protein n=1 Tax=Nocardia spumae TaxID=2887190 RepID=UPI0027E13829|nr:PH domain-containing protein [Nocardia spumae]